MKLRAATPADAAAIAEIYAPYVTATAISFETVAPDAAEMAARIEAGLTLYPWLAAADDSGTILGYAYAGAFRARPAYRFAVETTVYVADRAQRKGIGRLLYRALLGTLQAQGFTQAIAAITLPNEASVALHQALGFEEAGVYRQVGYKLGQWRSVGLWQRGLASPSPWPAEPKPVADVWSG
ncbi:MAG TPA: arsinothricin resistance N-acetyltransferase ArsN1 family B [Allosphingosinicella sp.]|nr:arsinothricin resistance N-acetyltransferase ArsN1 family B [Allosphingosinicella sp.]